MTQELKQIIRVSNTDIKGDIPLHHALTKIRGIGYSFANAICHATKIDRTKKVGYLEEKDVKKIEECIKEPLKFNLPTWLLNRQRDIETGENRHIVTSTLKFQTEVDIKNMKKIKTYRGMRHAYGQPVRGQKTRAHFRHGAAVGVQRSKAKMQVQKKEGKDKD